LSGNSASTAAQPPRFPSGSSPTDRLVGADLTEKLILDITDASNGPGQDLPGRVASVDYELPLDCLATADSSVGSTCGANTTTKALPLGAVVVGKAAIWGVGQVKIYDSGPDGVRGNSDDELFEQQGLFAP
jgi:hypothetical protein